MAAIFASAVVPSALRARAPAKRSVLARDANTGGQMNQPGGKKMWLPGAENPSYLDGTIPGDYGFDPLGLAKEPALLARFREAEIIHCRWAMLGVVGALAVETLGYGSWVSADVAAIDGTTPLTYLGNELPYGLGFVTFVEVVGIAFAESSRQSQTDPEKRLYPGGAFDPLGLSKDPKEFASKKVKEVKNGRLAMLAWLGFFAQAWSTGEGPLANLAAHIADPLHANVGSNTTALPFLG